MNFDPDHGVWTTAHDVALVYLALTHGTDAHLAAPEVTAALERLRAWCPSGQDLDPVCVSDEAMRVYMGAGREAMVQTSAEAVRKALSPNECVGLLNDLAELAHADGIVRPAEVAFIQRFARYLGVDAGA